MQIFRRHLSLWVSVKMFSFYQTNEVRQKGKEKGLASIFSPSKRTWHTTEAIWRWACIIHANAPAECANAAERGGGFIRFGFHCISCVYLHGRSDVTWHFRLQFRGDFLRLASCFQRCKRHLCTSVSPFAPTEQLTAGPGGSPRTSPHPHSAVSLFNMADSLFFSAASPWLTADHSSPHRAGPSEERRRDEVRYTDEAATERRQCWQKQV